MSSPDQDNKNTKQAERRQTYIKNPDHTKISPFAQEFSLKFKIHTYALACEYVDLHTLTSIANTRISKKGSLSSHKNTENKYKQLP